MHSRSTTLSTTPAAIILMALLFLPLLTAVPMAALQNDPPPYVARVVYCGQYDRAWFLAHKNYQWGNTLTDLLDRSAKARCTWLKNSGLLPLTSQSNTYFGRAIGKFSDGLNHNDPYTTNARYDGVDANGNTTYFLTGADFACMEFVQGTTATVAPSLSCPPFSTTYPGGTGSVGSPGGGVTWRDFIRADEAAHELVSAGGGAIGTTGVGGIYAAHGYTLSRLGAEALDDPEGTAEDAIGLFQAAQEAFDAALRNDPTNAFALEQGAIALVKEARLAEGEARIELLAAAETRFLVGEREQPGSTSYNLGCVYALSGDEEAARTWLEAGLASGNLPSVDHMQSDSDLESISHTGWFQDILNEWEGAGHSD